MSAASGERTAGSGAQAAPGSHADRRGGSGWRARVRRTPGGGPLLKVGVFLLGALFVLLGLAALALPGPLTIPPVLLGVYVWASEFDWAEALLQRARRSALEAWAKARQRPVLSTITTGGGLGAAAAALWAVAHWNLVDRGTAAVGL